MLLVAEVDAYMFQGHSHLPKVLYDAKVKKNYILILFSVCMVYVCVLTLVVHRAAYLYFFFDKLLQLLSFV